MVIGLASHVKTVLKQFRIKFWSPFSYIVTDCNISLLSICPISGILVFECVVAEKKN